MKIIIFLLALIPSFAFAHKVDIDCYYPGHEEHFKNIDWQPWSMQGTGINWLSIDGAGDKEILLYRNCIIRMK